MCPLLCQDCPACAVSKWAEWDACTASGTQSRTRAVVGRSTGGCPALQDSQQCAMCEVSEWTDWDSCSGSGGIQERSRTVTRQPVGNDPATGCPALSEGKDCGGVSVRAAVGTDFQTLKGTAMSVADASSTGSWSMMSAAEDNGG